nr:unnamed protein product [Callosobruchus analis]
MLNLIDTLINRSGITVRARMSDNIESDHRGGKNSDENCEKRKSRENRKDQRERVRERSSSLSSSSCDSDSEKNDVSRRSKKKRIEDIIAKKVHAVIEQMQIPLAGTARIWYNGLLEYNKTWDEWKKAVLNAFSSHAYFVDNLKKMLDRKKIVKESMLHYYYSKCMLIRNCDISDNNAVSCIIYGLPPEHQGTAKSANFKTPDELFRGFLCKENVQTCLICKKPGHSTRNCFFKDSNNLAGTSSDKHHGWKTKECTYCKKRGHLKRIVGGQLQEVEDDQEAGWPNVM